MFDITAISLNQAKNYYAEDDYYSKLEHEKMLPIVGGDFQTFGLSEKFDYQQYLAGLLGKFPNDELAVQQKFDPRRAVYDCRFSAPKSFGIAALVAGDDRIIDAHQKAVAKAMEFIADKARVRVKSGGDVDYQECKTTWTSFGHAFSRRGDPDLHTHNALCKYAVDAEGRLRAIDNRLMMQAQKEASAIYNTELVKLAQEAGYSIVETKNGPELEGYHTRETIELFSNGQKAINDRLVELGIDPARATPEQRQKANNDTRSKKKDSYDHASAQQWWRDQAAANGIAMVTPSKTPVASEKMEAKQAVEKALDHLSERDFIIPSRYQLAYESARASGWTANVEEIDQEITARIQSGELIMRQGGVKMTSKRALEIELAMQGQFNAGIGKAQAIADEAAIGSAIQRVEQRLGGKMSAGQRSLIATAILSNNRFFVAEGDAGTGKSTAMEVIKDMAIDAGLQIKGLAPSKQAVDSLAAAGIPLVKTSQHAFQSGEFWKDVDHKTVLVIDEAGLIDTRSMQDIMQKASEKGARVLMIGDSKQYGSVEAGAAFYQLTHCAKQVGEFVNLKEMRRGKGEILDIHFASRDDQVKALKLIHEQGRMKAFRTEAGRHNYIAREYGKLALDERLASYVLTGTNADRIKLNNAIRGSLGLDNKPTVTIDTAERKDLTRQQMHRIASYEKGDLVTFGRNQGIYKRNETVEVVGIHADHVSVKRADGTISNFRPAQQGYGVNVGTKERLALAKGDIVRFTSSRDGAFNNGDRGKVTSISDKEIKIQLGSREVSLDLSQKQNASLPLRYAYAQTGHSAQGATAKGKIWQHMTSDDSTVNKNSFYTNITRSTHHVEVVCDAVSSEKFAKIMGKAQADAPLDERTAIERPMSDEEKVRLAQRAKERVAGVPAFWGAKGTDFVKVENAMDPKAIAEALKVAREKFGDSIKMTGPTDFRQKALETAGDKIQFVDKKTMELIEQNKAIAAEKAGNQAFVARFGDLVAQYGSDRQADLSAARQALRETAGSGITAQTMTKSTISAVRKYSPVARQMTNDGAILYAKEIAEQAVKESRLELQDNQKLRERVEHESAKIHDPEEQQRDRLK